jgi:diguanylate cyclase (GGDEF)-like protein
VRLQAKLALALAPLVAGPLLALGWLSYGSLKADIEQNAAEDLRGALHIAEDAVAKLTSRAQTDLAVFAKAPGVEQYARASDDPDRHYLFQPGLLRLLHGFREAYPEYLELRFLLPDATVDARAVARGREAGTEVGSLDARAAEHAPGGAAPSMWLAADAPEPAFELLHRISLPDAYGSAASGDIRTRGYLGMTVSLEPVYEGLRKLPFDFAGFVQLVLPDGRVLFDTRAGTRPEHLNDGLALLLAVPEAAAGAAPRLVQTPCWLAGSQFAEPGLFVIAALPRTELKEPLLALKLQMLGLTLGAIGLLWAVLWALLRKLVLTPVRALHDAAERIGAGDLRPAIPVSARDELGDLAGAVRDMGERLALAHSQVEHQAFHDHLTDLPNRRLIRELLADEVGKAQHDGAHVAVLFVDIDNFKRINDALGHAAGDELLRVMAQRLGEVAAGIGRPRRSHLARLGGDELLMVLAGTVDPNVAGDIAGRVLAAVTAPVELGELRQVVTASIGIALYPRDAADAEGLIRAADLAMYAAKADGRNAMRFYSGELNARVAARMRLENALRCALEGNELRVYYQPIVDVASGRPEGFEALLRWQDDELGVVSPTEFIPIAEDTGMILAIGRWALGEVCRQIAAWRAAGIATPPVAVNVSAVQLNREDLAPVIAYHLADYGLTPADLVVEVTESALMALDPRSEARFMALRRLGVAVHIDDFGTGYSSLSYLRRFQFDCVKIDASFIRGVTDAGDDRILVTAIIALAHALETKVIAEGIETAAQAAALAELGCRLGQGFYYARPQPPEAAGRLVGQRLPAVGTGDAAQSACAEA